MIDWRASDRQLSQIECRRERGTTDQQFANLLELSPVSSSVIRDMPQLTLSSYISAIDSAIKTKNGAALAKLFPLFSRSPSSSSTLLLEFLEQQSSKTGFQRSDRILGPVSSTSYRLSLTLCIAHPIIRPSTMRQPGTTPNYAGQFSRTLKQDWAEIATCHVHALVALNVSP